jgi:hypothetical protein
LQFGQLAEPFLLIGEIEQHIRMLIEGRFSLDELKAARDPEDDDREISGVADLTLGEYIRRLESPGRWSKTNLRIDGTIFIEQLQAVRKIRNDVMHSIRTGLPKKNATDFGRQYSFCKRCNNWGPSHTIRIIAKRNSHPRYRAGRVAEPSASSPADGPTASAVRHEAIARLPPPPV